MDDRFDREEDWRRFDEDIEFQDRPGALDRRWGYGERLRPGYAWQQRRRGPRLSEYEYDDEYNAPDYWTYQQQWMQPGPFTGVGPRGYRRSDERIFEDVCERLTQHSGIDAENIQVEVQDGEVTLSGDVEDRSMKRMVEANIEMIPGVIDVHNRLKLRSPESAMERRKRKTAEEMAEKFPGGPEPSGPAGY